MARIVLQSGYQPFPGYVLKTKLGAGGYGEVWSADAPGGLTKAIKFVFGTVDDERAATELRSLNRIKKLNHPFILSLERVEVVDSQLVIVTELAQGSLFDRYSEFRKRGFVGIPRDRLLRYLADAADGLDYLCQEHDLQHLDVKPGNLLLIADRVKVADFGLVKDLQSISQSLMSGMTPTYAAPEMFDGRPGRYSDQYSLAIVYQELLTGTLPFRGRTAAQLANEHVNKTPNLDAVPLMERSVIAKALSKKPHMRFGDCREFMRALESCRADAKLSSSQAKSRVNSKSSQGSGNRMHARRAVNVNGANGVADAPNRDSGFEFEARPVQLCNAMPPLANTPKSSETKLLVVGLGGTGGLAIQKLRTRYQQWRPEALSKSDARFSYIDTDSEWIEKLTSESGGNPIPHSESIPIRLNSAQYFRQCRSPDLQRISRRWVFNIPRSQKTEGVRPLGMLAFLDNARRCYDALVDAIQELYEDEKGEASLKVYILASAHGGTGGAIVSEIGYLLRQIAASVDLPVEIQTMLLCADAPKNLSAGLGVASAIACLGEIEQQFECRGLHEPLHSIPSSEVADPVPFDFVTLVHGGILGEEADWLRAIDCMAEVVWAQEQSDLGRRLENVRSIDRSRFEKNGNAHGKAWLGTAAVHPLSLAAVADSDITATRCCVHATLGWASILRKQILDLQIHQGDMGPSPQVTSDLPWSSDLFRSLQFSVPAWVRRVITAVAPTENSVVDSHRSSGGHGFDNEELTEIEAIATRLGVDPGTATLQVQNLVRTSRKQILTWLDQNVLGTVAGWKHLGQILGEIERRFQANVARIIEISKQLHEAHDAALEHAYEGQDAPSQDLELTLDTLSLEMKFHSLASKLQARMARDVNQMSRRWITQVHILLDELSETSAPMLRQLGMSESVSQAPEISSFGKDVFSSSAIAFLLDYSLARLGESWLMSPLPGRRFHSECKGLPTMQAWIKHTIDEFGMSTDSVLSTSCEAQPKSNDWERGVLEDRYGWGAIYGDITDRSGNIQERMEKCVSSQAARAINSNLRDEFNRTLPKLAKSGADLRNVLMISDELTTLLDDEHLQQIHERRATIINDPTPSRCLILALGDRLEMGALIERQWPPSRGLKELTQRLLCTAE
jgi:serine/threonine protein kinase